MFPALVAAPHAAAEDADLPVGVVRTAADGSILSVNPEAHALLGLLGGAVGLCEGGAIGAELRALASRLDRPGARVRRRLRGPEGGAVGLEVSRSRNGGLVAVLTDESAVARLDEEAHRARARWAALADWTPRAAVYTLDLDGRVIGWSRSAERFEGMAATEAVGLPLRLLLERARFAVDAGALLAEAAETGSADAEGWRFAFSGGPAWVRLTLRALRDAQGAPDGYLAVARAAAETSSREAELRRLAATDPLTGVLNRRALFESVETAKRVALARGEGPAAILCDIDCFKALNDAHGHATGDAALRCFAMAAQGALRMGDLIGRLGGDEFVVALPGADATRAAAVAERLRAAAEALGRADPALPPLTASFGVAAPLSEAETFAQTMARADAALYRAKREGRNRVASA